MKLILALTFLALAAVNVHASSDCEVEPADRVNCGYPGISKDTCEAKGCCFDNSIHGVIWCFNKPTCEVEPADRVDCGYPGISKAKCEAKGCCFNNSKHGVIWCFNHGF